MDNWLVKKVKSDSSELESSITVVSIQSQHHVLSSAVEQNCTNTLPVMPAETDDSGSSLFTELEDGCFQHQDVSELPKPVQVLGLHGKTRRFQPAWFKRFPWLHYNSRHLNAFLCSKATALSLMVSK